MQGKRPLNFPHDKILSNTIYKQGRCLNTWCHQSLPIHASLLDLKLSSDLHTINSLYELTHCWNLGFKNKLLNFVLGSFSYISSWMKGTLYINSSCWVKQLINIPIVTHLILVKGVTSPRKDCTVLEVITWVI